MIDEEHCRTITRKEVHNAVSKMKTGKAPDLDECHIECAHNETG